MTDGLIQAAQSGDKYALTVLIEDHYNAIYRFCYWKVQNIEAAQDITQETFLRFIGSLRHYTSQGKLRAYLYTIARNLCNDWHRQGLTCTLDDAQLTLDHMALMETDRNDDHLLLQSLVDTLPAHQREVIVLRYGHDLKLAEIAEITSTSRFTVQYRIKTALSALKKKLKQEEAI